METLDVEVTDEGRKWVRQVAQQCKVGEDLVLRALFTVGTKHPDEVATKIAQLRSRTR